MKTKLLKKIRKRYEIVKVTKVSSSTEMWNWFYMDCEKEFGLPFFVLEDNADSWRTRAFTTQEKAYDQLRKWIKSDYEYHIKKDESKTTKIWHVTK